jgi:hypothetical protein
MKSLNRMAVALLIASLASVSAFAKAKREKVTFPTNVKVNGTVVTKGVYDVKFDDKTGELTIEKGSKVIARATVNVEKRAKKAQRPEFRTTGSGDDTQLIAVTFSGTDQELKISGSQASR